MGACDGVISETVVFKRLERDEKVSLLVAQRKPNCKIDIELDYAVAPREAAKQINAEIVKLVYGYEDLMPQEATDSFVRHYVRTYREELEPLYRVEAERNGATLEWYDYEYTVNGEEKEARAGYVCYEIETERYEGGTAPISENHSLTFDVKTGARVHLSDVFSPGTEEELNGLLLQALLREFNCRTKEELQGQGVLLLTDMYATENFYLGRHAVKFVYNPYEIAPYEQGEIKLSLPYSDVKHLLRKNK